MRKCKHCNAVMPKYSNTCFYCDTFNEPEEVEAEEIIVSTSETGELRYCPHCVLPMDSVKILKDYDIVIEQCPKCHGFFFDLGELKALIKIISKNENIDINRIDIGDFNLDNFMGKIKYIKCPVCNDTMHRISFDNDSGVVYDYCAKHGIYLDSGELKQIIRYERSGKYDFINPGRSAMKELIKSKDISDDEIVKLSFKSPDMAKIAGAAVIGAILLRFFL